MGLGRRILLRGSESAWLRERLSHRAFVRRAVRRFIPGEELGDAIEAAGKLGARGMGSVLTVLGENVRSTEETQAVVAGYAAALEAIRDAGLDTDLSVKPTHLGLDLDPELALGNLDTLAGAAGAANRLLWLDMEASARVDRTLELYRSLRATHENVGICLQAYLFRTPEDLESLLPLAPTVRLVKGAYNEPPDIAYPRKSDVDASYLRLAARLLESGRENARIRSAFGTHDERLIRAILRMKEEIGSPRDGCEIQMLYGIGRERQSRLAREGHAVRVLVSYGDHWFPWYMRRLAERPANVGFVLRSMVRR